MSLARAMPTRSLAKHVGEHDTRLWRVVNHHVEEARTRISCADVASFGVDETACKRGHNYVTVFAHLRSHKVLFATGGRDAATIQRFKEELAAHGGDPAKVNEVCCDMSPAFIAGVEANFPEAHITFDRFHIMKVLGDAVDQVRREEAKTRPELAKSRYVWLKNRDKLPAWQQERLAALTMSRLNLKTTFQDLFRQAPGQAEAFLKRWCLVGTAGSPGGITPEFPADRPKGSGDLADSAALSTKARYTFPFCCCV